MSIYSYMNQNQEVFRFLKISESVSASCPIDHLYGFFVFVFCTDSLHWLFVWINCTDALYWFSVSNFWWNEYRETTLMERMHCWGSWTRLLGVVQRERAGQLKLAHCIICPKCLGTGAEFQGQCESGAVKHIRKPRSCVTGSLRPRSKSAWVQDWPGSKYQCFKLLSTYK